MVERRRIQVQGLVQGVGFRPFVYRLALEQELRGWVRNDGRGVCIEVEGRSADLDAFECRLPEEVPSPARIERSRTDGLVVAGGERQFAIVESARGGMPRISLAPDGYVCRECLAEMADPRDRRYRYPFINCTRCGPRFSIVEELPYDRPSTTMKRFALCTECEREYADPFDRRYHAQPVACPRCGPRCWLVEAGTLDPGPPPGEGTDPAAPIQQALGRLAAGQVVAIKGIGGFHLAVDARNETAVARLRKLKLRSRKPFAVMVRDPGIAGRIVRLNHAAEELLGSAAAPIVLAPRWPDHGLAEGVAPGMEDLGVMLPYSPLHHLLLGEDLDALVMTSGNRPCEPITADNRDALERLPADAHLLHDREIHVACDDSVVRAGSVPIFVRRARGYVPRSLEADHLPRRNVLGLGAELKVTVTTLSRGEMVVGRHLGDLDNTRAEAAFYAEVERMLRFGRVEPEAVAVDLHPDLATTRFAEKIFSGLPMIRVQHHHAHLAAVLTEHGVEPGSGAVGIVLDGMGLGVDGTIWGGEVLRGGYAGFERVGHLRPVPQPGGDRAAREPARMATSLLLEAGLGADRYAGYDPRFAEVASIRSASPLTSSAGRIFDAAAALLGVAPREQEYEGEAAASLEAVADSHHTDAYELPIAENELDTRALITALLEDRSDVAVRAARFHNGLADGFAALALEAGSDLVVLGGGCMVNRRLFRRLVERIENAGVRVIWPRQLPPGDGAISAGQAAVAACTLEEGT